MKKMIIKLSFVQLQSVGVEVYEQKYLSVSYDLLSKRSYPGFPKYVSALCLTICNAYVNLLIDRER